MGRRGPLTRRIPVIASIIVAAAVATMIALGIWQLGRADEKAALLERYGAAVRMSSEVRFPTTEADLERTLYRRTTIQCDQVLALNARAGTSDRGEKGWAHVANCRVAGVSEPVPVSLGFSRQPTSPEWDGGKVRGTIVPGPAIVSAERFAGLERLARPDPNDLPNNHLAYAGQWFFFALTALVIYVIAIRRRWKGEA